MNKSLYQQLVNDFIVLTLPWDSDFDGSLNMSELAFYIDWTDATYDERIFDSFVQYCKKRFGISSTERLKKVEQINSKFKAAQSKMLSSGNSMIIHPRREHRDNRMLITNVTPGIKIKDDFNEVEYFVKSSDRVDSNYNGYLNKYFFTDQEGRQFCGYCRGIFSAWAEVDIRCEYMSFMESIQFTVHSPYNSAYSKEQYRVIDSFDFVSKEQVEEKLEKTADFMLGMAGRFAHGSQSIQFINDAVKKYMPNVDNEYYWVNEYHDSAYKIKLDIFSKYDVYIP